MALTTKQRAKLRALANELSPILHIGKDGISDNIIRQADDALEARELIKASLMRNSPVDAKEACAALAEACGADPVQCIGSKFVLYRESKENKTIVL